MNTKLAVGTMRRVITMVLYSHTSVLAIVLFPIIKNEEIYIDI